MNDSQPEQPLVTSSEPDAPVGPADTCIRITDLSHRFETNGGSVRALENLDLEVYDREFFCLVGPSGCGKSTLLRIVSGLLEHDQGTVTVRTDADGDRPVSSMVFQEEDIFPWKSVIDNVAFGLKMRGVGKEQRYAIAREYLEKVNLAEFESAYPHELSGGMKQRVSIARTFANDPEMFLMDEPFGSLDAQTKAILQKELLSLWNESKKTVVYVTHDIREAIKLGDRVGVMSSRPGKIKQIVPVDIDRPRTRDNMPTDQVDELHETIWRSISDEVEQSMARD